jgi:hypothetical protein
MSPSGVDRSMKTRRAFGCITWINMAALSFLAVAFLFLIPVWYFGGWDLFSIYEGPALFGTLLIVPGMVFGAYMGARTLRAPPRFAARVGTWIGLLIGWSGYSCIVWLENLAPQEGASNPLLYAFLPVLLIGMGLILAALLATNASFQLRRRLVVAAAVVVGLAGGILLLLDFDWIITYVAFVSAVSGAAGGWTAGLGYARAGGKEMPVSEPPERV